MTLNTMPADAATSRALAMPTPCTGSVVACFCLSALDACGVADSFLAVIFLRNMIVLTYGVIVVTLK